MKIKEALKYIDNLNDIAVLELYSDCCIYKDWPWAAERIGVRTYTWLSYDAEHKTGTPGEYRREMVDKHILALYITGNI